MLVKNVGVSTIPGLRTSNVVAGLANSCRRKPACLAIDHKDQGVGLVHSRSGLALNGCRKARSADAAPRHLLHAVEAQKGKPTFTSWETSRAKS